MKKTGSPNQRASSAACQRLRKAKAHSPTAPNRAATSRGMTISPVSMVGPRTSQRHVSARAGNRTLVRAGLGQAATWRMAVGSQGR